MKLLSTISTIFLGVTATTAVAVKAPSIARAVQARDICEISMFTQPNFTGDSETFSPLTPGQCYVSACHQVFASRTDHMGGSIIVSYP
jgi:hypothetical protein